MNEPPTIDYAAPTPKPPSLPWWMGLSAAAVFLGCALTMCSSLRLAYLVRSPLPTIGACIAFGIAWAEWMLVRRRSVAAGTIVLIVAGLLLLFDAYAVAVTVLPAIDDAIHERGARRWPGGMVLLFAHCVVMVTIFATHTAFVRRLDQAAE